MKLKFFDYHYAGSVVDHEDFCSAKQEILNILQNASVPPLDPDNTDPRTGGVKRRKREHTRGDSRDRYFFLPVDQKRLNSELDLAFKAADWRLQPIIVEKEDEKGPVTGLKGDHKKGRLQVEVQFGNMARWYTDVFKFQLSYALDKIDVAVLVVAMQKFANLIDENIAHFERVCRELPWAKMSLTLPIWVVGVEPDEYQPIRQCYDRAAEVWIDHERGKAIAIPFEESIAKESSDGST